MCFGTSHSISGAHDECGPASQQTRKLKARLTCACSRGDATGGGSSFHREARPLHGDPPPLAPRRARRVRGGGPLGNPCSLEARGSEHSKAANPGAVAFPTPRLPDKM